MQRKRVLVRLPGGGVYNWTAVLAHTRMCVSWVCWENGQHDVRYYHCSLDGLDTPLSFNFLSSADAWYRTVVLFCFVLFWKSMYQSAVRSFGIHSTSIFLSCFKICLPATLSPSLHYYQLLSSLSRPSPTSRTLEPSILSAYTGVYVLLTGQEEAWILSQMLPQQSISSHQSFQPEKKKL